MSRKSQGVRPRAPKIGARGLTPWLFLLSTGKELINGTVLGFNLAFK